MPLSTTFDGTKKQLGTTTESDGSPIVDVEEYDEDEDQRSGVSE